MIDYHTFSLFYHAQTDAAVCFVTEDPKKNKNQVAVWLPKSQIEVDGVATIHDFDFLVYGEQVDVYIPFWLVRKHNYALKI